MDVKNTIAAVMDESQYDENAKKLLGNKKILSHILIKTVPEFKGMSPKEVETLIEGEPKIAAVPVEPGLTNAKNEKEGGKIIGFNTENSEINEGLIRFDIVFYVRMKDGLSQIIINVEAQRNETSEYELIDRAVFYVCRLISSQKGRDFQNTNYSDIKRVYSIWICMNMKENTLAHIHLTKEDLLGKYDWGGRLGLLNIVMVGLSKELPEHDEEHELHRLLGTLLSDNLAPKEKIDIVENEYDIVTEGELRKELDNMGGLGRGYWERGLAEGKAEGKAEIILKMYEKNYTVEQIADIVDKEVEEVREIIDGAMASV